MARQVREPRREDYGPCSCSYISSMAETPLLCPPCRSFYQDRDGYDLTLESAVDLSSDADALDDSDTDPTLW